MHFWPILYILKFLKLILYNLNMKHFRKYWYLKVPHTTFKNRQVNFKR